MTPVSRAVGRLSVATGGRAGGGAGGGPESRGIHRTPEGTPWGRGPALQDQVFRPPKWPGFRWPSVTAGLAVFLHSVTSVTSNSQQKQ